MKRSRRPAYFAVTMLILSVIMLPADYLHANKGDTAHSQIQSAPQQAAQNEYLFVTARGSSLSQIVRRALQLYDEQNADMTLSPAAAIFAETHIVQELGGRLLEVGEQVRISHELLKEYTTRSSTLDARQLAAWKHYADRANFNVSAISPLQTSSTNTDRQGQSKDIEPINPAQEERQESEKPVKQNPYRGAGRVHPVYWAAALSALAVIYYVWDRRRK